MIFEKIFTVCSSRLKQEVDNHAEQIVAQVELNVFDVLILGLDADRLFEVVSDAQRITVLINVQTFNRGIDAAG